MLGSQGLGLGSVGTAAEVGSGAAPPPPVVTPNLAAVYAAGADDPKTKDLMAMLSGTTARFQANTDANPLPLVALYETAASKPLSASGYPSLGQSLATDLGTLIGGRLFNWFEMFDPNWNGTLAQLSAYTWQADTCSFQQQPSTAWRRTNVFAARNYTGTKNWQPQATPAGPVGSGPATTLHQVSLYNTSDPGLRVVDQLDGYGQTLKELTPIQNGVIYERAIHYSNRLIAPAANDGVGLAVYNGDISHGGDTPQVVFDFRTVGATAAGDWYAAIALRDTAGDGLLHDVVTFKRTGVDVIVPATFDQPITLGAGIQPNATVSTWFKTATFDLRTPGFYAFNTPTVAGKTFVAVLGRLVLLTRDAALTTAPTILFAQNGVDISVAVVPGTAAINSQAAPENTASLPSVMPMPDMTTFPIQLHISVGAAGAGLTTCQAYFLLQGLYV